MYAHVLRQVVLRRGKNDQLRPRSQDAGTKLCRHKMNTVCNCSHADAGSVSVSSLFFSYLNFTLITVDNIYHSQNVSSNCNEILRLCVHTAPRW